jgi:RNA polymerase sporulation-specific sigma factor
MDRISSKGTQDEYIEKIVLRQIIDTFDERDKKIIYLRYFRDETQSEIAKELGVSQVQISRLESKILERIRKELV